MGEGPPAAEPLGWGILGAARIAGKILPALRASGARVEAVAARDRARAEQLAAAHGIRRTWGRYEEVLADPAVDAVYLPLVNHLHHEWLVAIADAGKHCLCEKPLALSAAEATHVTGRFRDAGLCLQEAFMWRHHPQVRWLDRELEPGKLGSPRRIHASFSFPLDRPHDYRWRRSLGGGVLWDIGCYGVNAARYFFRSEPIAASFRGIWGDGEDAADETVAGWLDFGEGRLATISCSFRSAFDQGLVIAGTEGTARVERPWLAVDQAAAVRTQRGYEMDVHEFEPVNAYRAMIEHFTRAVRGAEPWPGEDGGAQAHAMGAAFGSVVRQGEPSSL